MDMAASPRRVGAETSQTRDALLEAVAQMMLEEGYASVTYRALAAKAGVTPSLVQYYFPSLDDIFVAAIRRYSERNLQWLTEELQRRADDPLHALWESSWHESTSALMTEFMALGNHRKSIRSEIAAVTDSMRRVQVEALVAKFGNDARLLADLSFDAVVLLINGVPKLLGLEESVGVDTAHAELIAACERFLDAVEPRAKPRRRSKKAPTRRR
ncbi:TetR/AcrR family transcriptional regulator [Mycobacterium avium]|uniref:TetR/AcrR family transcriptional regulator n=1 Tax=Mycobacterium avium TaxID=1764 RepID=UPI000366526C|nr:TetR/AcrR family transcriptional regulator [Mycobacterium avium]ETB11767.1 TetR family transcriptional regulator [Mycobacterium avium subsp. silvaticum ATCC 49884]ETB13089.1 TetR family transcriptional regulator [Mycobacterium avium subsp. paratuberculosis 08-8281]ETB18606.1 TetR family transcriptional regulator [Mycobacterium avium subsp. avium 10-9275]ETB41561.1 TetR family transcriptional regulator [Mycobacterium avium subsp. paratuberculosis 11-1786]MDV3264646.1 TetR/AcrR family transcr